MDEFDAEFLINQLVDVAFRTCQERGILLSEQARRFIRFAAEAFMKDPPKSSKPEFSTDQFYPGSVTWMEKGQSILDRALQDNRITRQMELREEVSFPIIIRVLSDAGYKELLSMGFKD